MNPIRVIAVIIAVLTGGSAHAMSQYVKPKEPKEYQIQVTVDTTGHISSIKPEQHLRDKDLQALKDATTTWQFGVPKVDGKPVPCTTWIRVQFIPESSSAEPPSYTLPPSYTFKYAVNDPFESPGEVVKYVGNGPYVEFKPLPYPTHLYRWSIAAIFYVRFVVEANGTIDNVQLIQAWTSGGKPIGDAMQDVTKGVIHWKAKPMLVGGQPIATAMIAPVSFFTNGSLDKDKPDSGMAIASDSPNSGQPVGNIPESGALSP